MYHEKLKVPPALCEFLSFPNRQSIARIKLTQVMKYPSLNRRSLYVLGTHFDTYSNLTTRVV